MTTLEYLRSLIIKSMFDNTHRHRNTRNSFNEYEFHAVGKPAYKRPNNKWLKLSIVFVLLFAISSIAYIAYFVEFTPNGMQISHITPPEAPYHGTFLFLNFFLFVYICNG